MARQFTREQFYELVWSKPMTHLAKEFALSDVALHKICKKHGVPSPPVGWWAKKAAGHQLKQPALPPASPDAPRSITIAAGELRQEPQALSDIREHARILASSIPLDEAPAAHPIVGRTVARLCKAKPNGFAGLVAVEGPDLIKCEIAPASIDRFALVLNRIAGAAKLVGIELVRGETSAAFSYEEEILGFSVTEGIRREKHVPTDKELAQKAAWERERSKRWQQRNWDPESFSFLGPRIPEWDHHPSGQLSFELENVYVTGTSPRRSFRDAKVQRLEKMASDIAVGVVMLAAAKKQERLRRAEEARRAQEARERREQALRTKYVDELRGKALDAVLEEIAALERLRGLVRGMHSQITGKADVRVATFIAFAEERLRDREAALSPEGLQQRFTEQRLFGEDDGHDFRLPHFY